MKNLLSSPPSLVDTVAITKEYVLIIKNLEVITALVKDQQTITFDSDTPMADLEGVNPFPLDPQLDAFASMLNPPSF